MANTEGMPDEVMASLLTPSSSAKASGRSIAMQQRLEQPMGERPAATVIRPSSRRETVPVEKETNEIEGNEEEESLPPILGSIVERDVSNVNKGARASARKSHFSQQRQGKKGFPSIHMPLGTFVKPQTNNRSHQETKSSAKQQTKSRIQPEEPVTAAESIENDSARDAQAMLEGMTPSEIQESVQELQAALSDEMIAFLKKRGQQRRAAEKVQPVKKAEDRPPAAVADSVEEKERVATILSSIRTVEDLDAAYAAENLTQEQKPSLEADDDWETACKLLRSTVHRQTVWAAKVVCQRLKQDVSEKRTVPVGSKDEWPYPILLPVSLRCLLDVSLTQNSVLHSYVLQSLYALLQLRAPVHHVVDVKCSTDTMSSIYQEYFMDDAIPTLPFGTSYPTISVEPIASKDGSDAVAYSTSSSSTSAQQDGEAFLKDPMWTMLTKMRILPRLGELLSASTAILNKEGIVAVCGILSMLSVRSAGAASAISQHPSILPNLLRIAVSPDSQQSGFFDAKIALPCMILLCTLARQSKSAAAAISIDTFVPSIAAMTAENNEEHKLQKWAFILWRTMLRYGVGLSSLSTYVSLSIPHLATQQPSEYSLSTEFLGAFANVCHCLKVANCKPHDEWSRYMSSGDAEGLSMAFTWLDTTIRQTIEHNRRATSADNDTNLDGMRLAAARLYLIQAYVSSLERGSTDSSTEIKSEKAVVLSEVLVSMEQVIKSSFVTKAFALVSSADSNYGDNPVSVQEEAVACAFIDALASLLSTLFRAVKEQQQEASREVLSGVSSQLKAKLVSWLSKAAADSSPHQNPSPQNVQRARQGWWNTMNFHINRFLVSEIEFHGKVADDFSVIRSHAFSLIGNLERGDEAIAAILCSCDALFQTTKESSSESPLSSFLMKELCATQVSRKQLDHSFKLHHGFGITANGWGPFDTSTLLSEADVEESRAAFAELLLPMGPHWLSKLLSGTVLYPHSERDGAEDTVNIHSVVTACLELLLHLEHEKSFYAEKIPDGAKLYYLINVCLQPEDVLRDDQINTLLVALFDRYTAKLGDATKSTRECRLATSFSKACYDHSEISQRQRGGDESEPNTADAEMLSLFMGEITTRALRCITDFLADLTKAYIEYGAQYEAFTRCVRVFLSAAFPIEVRCQAIRELRDVLHLLTLPSEESNPEELVPALRASLCGDVDSAHDSAQFLNLIASIIKTDSTASESKWNVVNGGFFFLFAMASLARSLAISIRQEGTGSMEAHKRRIMQLSADNADVVIEIALRINEMGNSNDVEATVVQVARDYGACPGRKHIIEPLVDDQAWDVIVAKLSLTQG